MDKRLSIALLLTAIIVAVTPIIFPTPRRATPPATSAAVQKSTPPAVQKTQPVSGQIAPLIVAPLADAGVAAPETGLPAITTAEITTVPTTTSTYQFTNVGAAPLAVSFRDYKSLTPVGGPV